MIEGEWRILKRNGFEKRFQFQFGRVTEMDGNTAGITGRIFVKTLTLLSIFLCG